MNISASNAILLRFEGWVAERDSNGDIFGYLDTSTGLLSQATVCREIGCSRNVFEKKNRIIDGISSKVESEIKISLDKYNQKLIDNGTRDLVKVNRTTESMAETVKRSNEASTKAANRISTLEAKLANAYADNDSLRERLKQYEFLEQIASSGKGIW